MLCVRCTWPQRYRTRGLGDEDAAVTRRLGPRLGSKRWPSRFARRALTMIGVRTGLRGLGAATFKIMSAPHMTPHMVSIGP